MRPISTLQGMGQSPWLPSNSSAVVVELESTIARSCGYTVLGDNGVTYEPSSPYPTQERSCGEGDSYPQHKGEKYDARWRCADAVLGTQSGQLATFIGDLPLQACPTIVLLPLIGNLRRFGC